MQDQTTSLTRMSNILFDRPECQHIQTVIEILVFCNIKSYISYAVYKIF